MTRLNGIFLEKRKSLNCWFTFLDSSWYELSSFTLSTSSCRVMILLLATASCGDKSKQQWKQKQTSRSTGNVFEREWNVFSEVQLGVTLTSSVSFVLDFSRASTLAWRLFTDALEAVRNIILVQEAAIKWRRERERRSCWHTLAVCSTPPHNSSDPELLWSGRHWGAERSMKAKQHVMTTHLTAPPPGTKLLASWWPLLHSVKRLKWMETGITGVKDEKAALTPLHFYYCVRHLWGT